MSPAGLTNVVFSVPVIFDPAGLADGIPPVVFDPAGLADGGEPGGSGLLIRPALAGCCSDTKVADITSNTMLAPNII